MKALSIQQPYAWAILRGGKDVENRKVAWTHRGPLLIHASQKYAGAQAYDTVRELSSAPMPEPGAPGYDPAFEFGAIIGVVDVTGVHKSGQCGAADGRGCSPWAEPYSVHLQLANPRVLERHIPCNGRLGLWTPAEDVLERVRRTGVRP